jgi:hypothetical protein
MGVSPAGGMRRRALPAAAGGVTIVIATGAMLASGGRMFEGDGLAGFAVFFGVLRFRATDEALPPSSVTRTGKRSRRCCADSGVGAYPGRRRRDGPRRGA